MHRLAGRRIFSLGEREFIWEHVVLAAYLWAEIPALERRIAHGLAAQNRLADAGEPVLDDDVEVASTRWRYERDLISADDLESWLSARELGLEEWLAYIRRSESAARSAARGSKRHAPAPDEIGAVMFAEAMCSGTVGALTERLAGRTAIFGRVTSEGRRSRAPAGAKLRTALERVPRTVKQRGLFGMSAADSVQAAEMIAAMDVVFERFVKTLAAQKTLVREIESHALEWTRIGCRTLTFGSQAPAREAALLIREDGMPIAKAASVAKAKVVVDDVVLEDVGGPFKGRLLAAQPGDLVGPVEVEEGFAVTLVTERVPPSVDDREIRERARDRVERRTVGAEIEKRIRWHERF
jgi:hypothetical protein